LVNLIETAAALIALVGIFRIISVIALGTGLQFLAEDADLPCGVHLMLAGRAQFGGTENFTAMVAVCCFLRTARGTVRTAFHRRLSPLFL
jgi:hypothetical protein